MMYRPGKVKLSVLLIFFSFQMMANEIITSPNGLVELEFSLNNENAPVYSIKFKGKQVIYPSTLGITFSEGAYLGKFMDITKSVKSSGKESYTMVAGKASKATGEFSEL